MYNRVIMLGRITQDLELKTTPNGVPVLSFSIAVDRRFQTKGAEKKADFFNCVAWRNEAEFISRFWTKGRPILVEGELQNRSYVDKNNVTRYITEIIVDRASFTGDKRPEGAGGGYQQPQGFPAAVIRRFGLLAAVLRLFPAASRKRHKFRALRFKRKLYRGRLRTQR